MERTLGEVQPPENQLICLALCRGAGQTSDPFCVSLEKSVL